MEIDEKYLPSGITTNLNADSFVSLLNPLSSVLGSGKDYVPAWLIKMFTNGEQPGKSSYWKHKVPGKMAHILAKITTGATVFGGVAYLLRALMHSLDIDNIQAVKAGDRASKKLDTTKIRPTEPALDIDQNESDSAVENPYTIPETDGISDVMYKQQSYPLALAIATPIAIVAATIAASKLSDKHFDSLLGDRLDKQLLQAKKISQERAIARIRDNRNIKKQKQSPEQVSDLQKTAALYKNSGIGDSIETALGLVLAALVVTGGVLGFNWQRSNSPAVAEYKAYKKGLQTYNKQRSLQEMPQSFPLDDKLVAQLDSNLNTNKNKPMNTVQLDPMNEVLV